MDSAVGFDIKVVNLDAQGLGASGEKNYIILQGGELTCFHFLSRRVKLIVTSERLIIFKISKKQFTSRKSGNFPFQRDPNC